MSECSKCGREYIALMGKDDGMCSDECQGNTRPEVEPTEWTKEARALFRVNGDKEQLRYCGLDACDEIDTLTAENKAQAKRIEDLTDDLRDFGNHLPCCNYPHDKAYGCKCGYVEVEEREKAILEKRELPKGNIWDARDAHEGANF